MPPRQEQANPPRASHRTTLVLYGSTECVVRETSEEVVTRARSAIRDDGGWFCATAEPEGETVWINGHHLLYVGRERTPLERLQAEQAL